MLSVCVGMQTADEKGGGGRKEGNSWEKRNEKGRGTRTRDWMWEIDRVQYLLSGLTHPQIRRIDDNAVEIGRGCYFHARYHVISLRSRSTG